MRQQNFTWSTEFSSNPDISSVANADPDTSDPQVTTTTQTLDQFGNVTQSQIYDFGNSSMLATRHPTHRPELHLEIS